MKFWPSSLVIRDYPHIMSHNKSVAEVISFLQMWEYNQAFLFNTVETYNNITSPEKSLISMGIVM